MEGIQNVRRNRNIEYGNLAKALTVSAGCNPSDGLFNVLLMLGNSGILANPSSNDEKLHVWIAEKSTVNELEAREESSFLLW